MNLQVYCTSLFWCLVFSQIHEREIPNNAKVFQNDPALSFYLQNNKEGPFYEATESLDNKRPSFEYVGESPRNTHGGYPIHFSKNSPLHPDRNKGIIIFPNDQKHSEISEQSNVEKPKEDLFFGNNGNKGGQPNNEYTFERSQTYFHKTNSTHTVRKETQGTFVDSYGNRHEISNIGSKKTSEESTNGYFVTNSNSNNHRISKSSDRNRFNSYGSDRHENRDFPVINRLENNKYNQNPASKIKFNEIKFQNVHPSNQGINFNNVNSNATQLGQASGTFNLGDLQITENSPNIQKTGNLQFGNFKIQNSQPITKIMRTFYVNGVKVDDDNASIDSIINSFLIKSYLNQTNKNTYDKKISDETRYNPNIDLNVQQNSDNKPQFALNHLRNREQYKNNFGNSQKNLEHPNNKYNDNQETYFNQQPNIDIRMGHFHEIPAQGKLAKLREKGRNIKNATNIYGFGHKRAATDSIDNYFNNHDSHKQERHAGEVTLSGRIIFTEKTEKIEVNKHQQQVIATENRLKLL